MSRHKISITIPVYNGEKYLRKCLESVFAQDCELHEIIIINNNSTDKTAEIIKSYQSTHSNLVYVFESVQTRGAARNAGLRAVTGDIIVMTDVDCVVPTDWVRLLTKLIVEGKERVTTGYQYNLLPQNYWARET
jgi:glycosyltransferase involved in cell wall biosynthesis